MSKKLSYPNAKWRRTLLHKILREGLKQGQKRDGIREDISIQFDKHPSDMTEEEIETAYYWLRSLRD